VYRGREEGIPDQDLAGRQGDEGNEEGWVSHAGAGDEGGQDRVAQAPRR
jgi:hypothetical protein